VIFFPQNVVGQVLDAHVQLHAPRLCA